MIIHYSHISKGRRINETAIIVHGYDKNKIKKTCRLLLVNEKFQYTRGRKTGLSRAVFRKVVEEFRTQNFGKPAEDSTEAQTKLANDPVIIAGAIAHATYHEHRTD